MNKSIEKDLNNKLSKKDYFLYLINRNIFILSSPLIIIALIVVFAFMVKKDGLQTSDFLYLSPILLFLLSYFQIFKVINNAVSSNKQITKLKITLNNKMYKELTNNGETSLEYSKFNSYYETKNYYYLYVDKINALILPKREFENDELVTLDKYFKSQIKKSHFLTSKTILGIIFSLALLISVIILIFEII